MRGKTIRGAQPGENPATGTDQQQNCWRAGPAHPQGQPTVNVGSWSNQKKKSTVVEISNWKQQMHWGGLYPVAEQPNTVIHHHAPAAILRVGTQTSPAWEHGQTRVSRVQAEGSCARLPGLLLTTASPVRSGNTACALWRMPLVFLEDH